MNKPVVILSEKRNQLPYIFLFIFILLTITLACTLPFKIVWTGFANDDQPAPVLEDTATVEVVSADVPQDGDEADSESDEQDKAAEESPTVTPSLTPEPENLVATISKNTNCRLGPKDVFTLIHIFLKGDLVDLLGKNEEGTFWYVQDQDGGSIQCWLWNEYATTEAMTENLPVFTPPPSPFPVLNFVVSYKKTTGGTAVSVNVYNSGNLALQSYSATFKDTVTSESVAVSSNKFGNAAKVSVGNTGVISSPAFSATTVGHQIKATIKACSNDGQAGKCVTVTINFESK